MLLGAQTKYLMASHGNLETPLTKTKGHSTFFLFFSFIPSTLSLCLALSSTREEKGQNSGYLKGLFFPKQCSAFSLTGSEDIRKMMPFVTLGFQYQFLCSSWELFPRRCRWILGWTIPCEKWRQKSVVSSYGGVRARRGLNQFTTYNARANEVQWESRGYKVRSAILLPFSTGVMSRMVHSSASQHWVPVLVFSSTM